MALPVNGSRPRVGRSLVALGALAAAAGLVYVMGPLRHPLAQLWGWYALFGGAAGVLGGLALQGAPPARRGARLAQHLAAVAGCGLFALAQWPPLHIYLNVAGPPVLRLAMAGHALLLAGALLALPGAWALAAAAAPGGRGWLGALAGAALVAASPLAWPWLLSATWAVQADPPPGAVIPVTAAFRFTWPAWQGLGNGGSIGYADGPGLIHATTGGGPGLLTIAPQLLEPGRAVDVSLRAGWRARTYRYRTSPVLAGRVDLYRAALAHWFRPPQGGHPPRAVALDAAGMPGLTRAEQETVALGLWGPARALADLDGGTLTPVPGAAGRFDPHEDALLLHLAAEPAPDGRPLRVRVTARRGPGVVQGQPPAWAATAVYSVAQSPAGWRFTPAGGSEAGRPFGAVAGP